MASESPQFAAIADEIYRCACATCPLYPRLDAPGFFPKFGAGGRDAVRLAIITMNPGAPKGRETTLTRTTLSRSEMHLLYEEGLLSYHREPRGGGIQLQEFIETHSGLAWHQVYYTEAGKCVTLKSERNDGTRDLAVSICAREYLGRELAAFPVLGFLIALGADAYNLAQREAESSPELARLKGKGRIVQVAHPAAWGNVFPAQFRKQLETAGRIFRSKS